MRAETRYTSSANATIAYGLVGDAPTDLVYVPGWFFNAEVSQDFAPMRRYLERLTSFARLVSVEKRGFGMSDRLDPADLPSPADRVADLEAVAAAEDLGKVAVMGPSKVGHWRCCGRRCIPNGSAAWL